MDKFIQRLLKNNIIVKFNIIFTSIIIFIFMLSIFDTLETYVTYKEAHDLKWLTIILGTIICCGIICRVYNRINKCKENTLIITSSILVFIIILIQVAYAYNFRYVNYSDLSEVQKYAVQIVNKGFISESNYLNRYTNNIPITIFWGIIFKIANMLGIYNYKKIGVIVNIFFIDAFILLLGRVIKNKYGIKKSTMILFLLLINPVIYTYVPTYYTNTLSLPFYIALIYFYDRYIESEYKIIYIILIAICSVIGIKIRVTVGIVLIAITMHLAFILKSKIKIKHIITFILCMLIGLKIYGTIENKYIKFDYSNTQYPITHWIMLGVNDNGGYSGSDVAYTAHWPTYKEKVIMTTLKSGKRILDSRIKGNLKRIYKKVQRVWSSGTFGFRQNVTNMESYSKLYPYIIGERSILFNYYCQIVYVSILVFVLISSIKNLKSNEVQFEQIYKLVIFFGFIFYLIWEANGRYGLMFLPFFMMLSLDGMDIQNNIFSVSNKISLQLSYNEKLRGISLYKVFSCLKRILIIVITILLLWNFGNYTKNKITTYDWVVNQIETNEITKKIDNEILEQTFISDKKFNTLELKIDSENSYESEYLVNIIDVSNSNNEYSKIIKITKNKSNYKLSFNDINKSCETKQYKIQIYKSNHDLDSVAFTKYYKPENDMYSNGNLYINKVEQDGDLMFKVYEINEKPIMNKYLYVAFLIVCMGLSLYSLNLKELLNIKKILLKGEIN